MDGGGGGPIDLRLQRDVFVYKPTVMTIMLGMNDGRYINHAPADDDIFHEGYRHIVQSVQKLFQTSESRRLSLRHTMMSPARSTFSPMATMPSS